MERSSAMSRGFLTELNRTHEPVWRENGHKAGSIAAIVSAGTNFVRIEGITVCNPELEAEGIDKLSIRLET
ncbi:hypothetical protein TNCT_143021, partial [Trichonephila clavata]